MGKIDIKDFCLESLEAFLAGLGKEKYRAKQIFKWLYQRGATSFDEMTNLSKVFRSDLEARAYVSSIEPRTIEVSEDGTKKYLFMLDDGASVESVLIPDEERATLCVSTQVGCAMGCSFCLTGSFKLQRNLRCAEIVNQICAVRTRERITNIVLMGMGEPLSNLDNVISALKIMICPDGFQISNRRVTVSTSGLIPEMEILGRAVTVNLAVSLNATTDEQRNLLMPVNRRYPLSDLLAACRRFPLPNRRMITFEYVMIRDVNDSPEDARRFVRLLKGIPAKVNLIPFNEFEGCLHRTPTREAIDFFHRYLLDRNITVITRSSRGADISAACGQLKAKLEKPSR
jgi:23S rRNA (adenine2503-C2)-methyltransferase